MSGFHMPARARRALAGARALLVASLALLGGALIAPAPATAAVFVGAALSDLKPEERVVVANPQPVQLLFQFKTKGAPNAAGTKLLKDKVHEAVVASGLFSTVSDTPVENGAILSVSIDNVVEPGELNDAAGKGFVTGATFFIAGSTVADHYVGSVEYLGGPNAPVIQRTARQIIVMQMGLINKTPEGVVKTAGLKDALFTMARQVVANPLNELARDPGFRGEPAAATSPAPAAQAAAPAVPATEPDSAQSSTPATPTPASAAADPSPKE